MWQGIKINSVYQASATTFAFSSVFILLLCFASSELLQQLVVVVVQVQRQGVGGEQGAAGCQPLRHAIGGERAAAAACQILLLLLSHLSAGGGNVIGHGYRCRLLADRLGGGRRRSI